MSENTYAQHDTGNAARLADRYGHLFRWVTDWQTFIKWDGRRWERLPDQTAIEALAKRSALDIALDARATAETDAAPGLIKWSGHSLDMPRIRACVNAVKSIEAVRIDSTELDAKPHLLNAANFTVDLRSGESYSHRATDLLTQIAPVNYRPDLAPESEESPTLHARRVAPSFAKLVERAFQVDETDETTEFMYTTFGYALVGDNPEQVFFILYGDTNTGKSQSLECVARVLGRDYADTTLNPKLVSKTKYGSHTEDVFQLGGRRFGAIDEVSDDIDLNEQEVKRLTGQSQLTIRASYGRNRIVARTWTLFLALNSMPNVEKWDAAVSRRVIGVISGPTVPESERRVKLAELIADADGEGILAVLVAGAQRYYALSDSGVVYGKERLPDHVARSTKHIEDTTDHIRNFFNEWIEVGEGYETRKDQILSYYKGFRGNKDNTHGSHALTSRIEELARNAGHSFVSRNGSNRKMLGVQLRAMARSDQDDLKPTQMTYN